MVEISRGVGLSLILIFALVGAASAAAVGGNVIAWGRNDYDQTNVPAGLVATQIAEGDFHSLALTPDGEVVAWGYNGSGQTNVPAGLVATQIAAGEYHSLALCENGTVVAWGYSRDRQTNVPVGLVATQIATGWYHSLALTPDGGVVAWGGNTNGQTNVPAGLVATQIAAGWYHSLALTPDGEVVAWGGNANGETNVPAGLVATQIAAGWSHSLALCENGTVVAWGGNANGETNVPAGLVATQIATRTAHSLALTPDGEVVAWGRGTNGVTNVPAGLVATQIAAGSYNSLAIGEITPPTSGFTASSTTGAVPLAVQFTDTSTYAATRLWDFGDGATSTAKNPYHTYENLGTYTVTLTVTNLWGSDTLTREDLIIVSHAAPEARIDAYPISGVPPLSVEFYDDSFGSPTTWLWDFGDGTTSTNRNPEHIYTGPGLYTVTLTVTNPAGTNVATAKIQVYAPVTASFTGSPVSGTWPLTVQFTDTSTGSPTSRYWDFGDGTTSTLRNPTHTYEYVGTFDVSLSVSNPLSSDYHVKEEYITVNQPVQGGGRADPLPYSNQRGDTMSFLLMCFGALPFVGLFCVVIFLVMNGAQRGSGGI